MADSEKVLNVAVVSAERALWTGQAKALVAKTPEGDIGILPGHEPVLALLVESAPLRIEEPDGSKVLVAIHGGFFSVAGNEVNVIAEVAELAEDIDTYHGGMNPLTATYLNRLSDLLFILARLANKDSGGDVLWQPGANR